MTSVAALGDSFTCGEGVGVRVPLDRTWTALLAAALPDAEHVSWASPGARVRDVLLHQVPRVGSPTIATLLVGLNDVARAGFSAESVRRDLMHGVEQLSRSAAIVLLGRLHDPVRMFWVPKPLRDLARRRVALVNAAVDEAAGLPRVHVLDLDELPALRLAGSWAVDRVHPSAAGHVALADAAAGLLRAAGQTVAPMPTVVVPRPASPLQRTVWVAGHGLPYAARHLRELGTPAVEGLLRRA